MDSETMKRWRAYHLRVACGENLNAEEDTFYQAGLRDLEREDTIIPANVVRLQQTRHALDAAEAEHQQLVTRREQLEREIAALEAALRARSRELLGTGD